MKGTPVGKIEEVKNVVYDCEYKDSSNFAYATFYHSLSVLVAHNLYSYYGGYSYFEGGPIYDFRVYPDITSIFLTASDDIYLVNDYGNSVSNLTTSDMGSYASPVFIPNKNLLTYGNSLISEINGGKIYSQNLETRAIDTLVSEDISYIFPIFLTEDESHLIYTSDDFYNYSIKSVNLDDLQDIKVLTNSIRVTHFGKNRSVDDKIAFTSKGTVYVLDLNTGDILNVATSGQFADISNDGQKVVFTTESEMYLVNSDGTNQQKLVSKISENKYLFLPSFSSDGQQIVFVESDFPYGFYSENN